MTNKGRALAVGLMAASCAGILISCKSSTPPITETPTVPVAAVEPATLQNNAVLSAEFEPFQDVDVMAKVAGYVRDIRVDIGSHVRTGDVLAVLEVPEIQDEMQKAKAGVAAAQANVVTAQAGIQRAEAAANTVRRLKQRPGSDSQPRRGELSAQLCRITVRPHERGRGNAHGGARAGDLTDVDV